MWVRIERLHRCHNCGLLVEVTWRWYPAQSPSTSTLAYCEPCTERLLGSPA
jgi:hypothetical protein